MDIENSSESPKHTIPSRQEVLLSGNFYRLNNPTQLRIYESHLSFTQNKETLQHPFTPNSSFEILYKDHQIQGIRFDEKPELQFRHQNWSESQLWEEVLLKRLKQRNFHECFKPIKKIGKGNFATVYLAHDKKRDLLVAIKAFVKNLAYKNNGKQALQNQIHLLRKLSSPNIMRLHGVYETDNSLYLVTEYIEGMTLEAYLKANKGQLSLKQRKHIIRSLLCGLRETGRQGILHRDLKPENILITKDGLHVKIVDFGLATETNLESYIFVRCGTPGFVAPEILRIKDSQKPVLNPISDMFSLGSIFYQMVFQRPLFDAYDHDDVLAQNRVCNIHLTHEMKASISFDEADLLQKMLCVNPGNRISCQKALQHSYITEKSVNMFGSMRNRVVKPLYNKESRSKKPRGVSIDNHENLRILQSLDKSDYRQ